MQHEITSRGPLLGNDGRLTERGYAKELLLQYDRAAVKAGALRIKEWDYYIVMNSDFAVALTVADNSYMGLLSASLLDFKTGWQHTESRMTAFPLGKTALPQSSACGETVYSDKQVNFAFAVKPGRRELKCEFLDFCDHKPLTCAIDLEDRGDQSMVIATPFKNAPKAFYYNQKINCMPASGAAEFDGRLYEFLPESSFGTLDWGRGVWTYNNTWYWGSASGVAGGRRFGFNIGYGFGDTSAASENMLFYDGRAHKLDGVRFNIPKDQKGRERFMDSWTFSSTDGRFEMDFVPVLDRRAKSSALVIESDQHQVFGKFTGRAVLDGGEVVEIKDFMGFAEKARNKW